MGRQPIAPELACLVGGVWSAPSKWPPQASESKAQRVADPGRQSLTNSDRHKLSRWESKSGSSDSCRVQRLLNGVDVILRGSTHMLTSHSS